MSPVSIAVLAVGMSVDALLASIGRGAAAQRPRFAEALRTGAIFGMVEAITPLLGWGAGLAASRYIAAIDHWIAFVLLGIVGGRMILHSLLPATERAAVARGNSLWTVMATAIGTSIDAMAVGVSLAFLDVNIIVVALAVGFATFLMSTGGMMTGNLIGVRFGRWAERIGGMALVGLGISILISHLSAG
ncbi:MAG: manganese efflux pump [Bosea sp.]|uniref:manganese efflux pump MntP n=1 Tax=Bosea sp. (in: a-proteobacteria) TaxID=1871050 RepID=UPI001ACF4420|nr:manganese efflux pump MntP family protein [Bosea sp. (in: a-proteobacteria)]MBN9469816.1 manganese efflux pump [Bosea sp. (in: a-proteobacteria)]